MPSRRPHASGRGGTGAARYRRNRAICLARSTTCWLCGHGGAQTADHIITAPAWRAAHGGQLTAGYDDLTNLAPAHGSMGNTGAVNRCPEPTCRLACNQVRGARMANPRVQSRRW